MRRPPGLFWSAKDTASATDVSTGRCELRLERSALSLDLPGLLQAGRRDERGRNALRRAHPGDKAVAIAIEADLNVADAGRDDALGMIEAGEVGRDADLGEPRLARRDP